MWLQSWLVKNSGTEKWEESPSLGFLSTEESRVVIRAKAWTHVWVFQAGSAYLPYMASPIIYLPFTLVGSASYPQGLSKTGLWMIETVNKYTRTPMHLNHNSFLCCSNKIAAKLLCNHRCDICTVWRVGREPQRGGWSFAALENRSAVAPAWGSPFSGSSGTSLGTAGGHRSPLSSEIQPLCVDM